MKEQNNNGYIFSDDMDEPNEVTYAAMEKTEIGEDMYGPFDSVAEFMEMLNEKSEFF